MYYRKDSNKYKNKNSGVSLNRRGGQKIGVWKIMKMGELLKQLGEVHVLADVDNGNKLMQRKHYT